MAGQGFSQNYTGRIRIEGTEIVADRNEFEPALIVPVHFNLERIPISSLDRCLLLDIQAALLGGPNTALLSRAERQPIPLTINRGYEFEIKLRFPLDTLRAASIEKDRQSDAQLSFKVRPILAGYERVVVKSQDGQHGQAHDFLMGGFEGPEAAFTVTIPQSHWVREILPHLKVTEYLLVEMPAKTGKKLLVAWDHLEKAESSYLNRNTKGVFAHCREAGDAINLVLKDQLGEKSFAFAERWTRAHKLFSHLSSLDLHIEDNKSRYPAETVKIDRPDVENLLFTAKSILKLAEQLLESKAH